MATVNVEVNGRTYVVGCEDGQEEHVKGLARQFDKQVQEVGQQVGSVGELRLFLLAALTTADELNEIRSRLDRLTSASGGGMLRPPPDKHHGVQDADDSEQREQGRGAACPAMGGGHTSGTGARACLCHLTPTLSSVPDVRGRGTGRLRTRMLGQKPGTRLPEHRLTPE